MSTPLERYRKLGIKEALPRISQYPTACKELSFILRGAYNHVPKNLQSLIFQDVLAAFRLLPEMQTCNGVTVAHLLLQSAEVALPKQKKNLAVAEFKRAKIAHKRRKANQEEIVSAQLPQDVLLHIFSFLDFQSLVTVGLVSRSWNFTANDSYLWELQYTRVFDDSDDCPRTRTRQGDRQMKDGCNLSQKIIVTEPSIGWKEAFKRAYIGRALKKFTSQRGYCFYCNTIVWLSNLKCSDSIGHFRLKYQQIEPVSPHEVVEYVLYGHISTLSSSDSDGESDDGPLHRLWAAPSIRFFRN